METFRGGVLMLFRWLVHYPIVHGTYRLRGWTRAPFMLEPKLTEKPGILVSNYGNYFYDDIIGMMLGPVWPFVFVRDSLYRIVPLRWLLRFFRAIPFVRGCDTRYSLEERRARNLETFEQVATLLRKGHWFSVFPETSPGHRSRLLTPLKPGVAHVALMAEDAAGWALGLRIYVYGNNYENKFVGRSLVYMRWAPPIEVAKYRRMFMSDPAAAEAALMKEVEDSMHAVVLEAETVRQLGDAHRLAFQRKQANFTGVQQALHEVVTGRSSPEDLRKLVCTRAGDSITYQLVGYALYGFGFVVSWPFRTFGRLCASEPAEEMTFQFLLWLVVLVAGTAVNGSTWAKVDIFDTWLVMSIWLWAWRRGIIAR